MKVSHLRDVNLDGLGHDFGKFQLLECRYSETGWYSWLVCWALRVQGALKFYNGYSCILDELNFRDPALVLILTQLVINLFEKKMTAVVNRIGLVHLRLITVVAHVRILMTATEMVWIVLWRLALGRHNKVDIGPVQTQLCRVGSINIYLDLA